MTTNDTIMKEMLDRATNPGLEAIDELSLQMFCLLVKSNPKLVDRAHEMIMLKVRSSNITESTRAINLLEECMIKCGPEFQDEASKFRFLNQLIRLVSKKYDGAETALPIKKRIMECLLLWTTEFPQKTKIREVYDMLCRDDGVAHGPTSAIQTKGRSTLGIDEEMLAKLIKSNNPEDYKRANLLIQNRVKQDARRMDFEIQCKNTVQEVKTTVGVLNDMLNLYESEGKRDERESETMTVMHEVYQACRKHKTFMEKLPTLIESLDESLTVDAIETNEALVNIIKRYKRLVDSPIHDRAVVEVTDCNSTPTDSKTTMQTPLKSSNADLLADLFCDETTVLAEPTPSPSAAIKPTIADEVEHFGENSNLSIGKLEHTSKNSLEDLHSIFNATVVSNIGETAEAASRKANEIFSNLDILEPVSVFSSPTSTIACEYKWKQNNVIESNICRKLQDIDKLSEDLFQKSLQDLERVYTFKKGQEKCTLNDLVKEKNKSQTVSLSTAKVQPKIGETRNTQPKEEKNNTDMKDDDDLLLQTKDENAEIQNKYMDLTKGVEPVSNITQVKHLADIDIDLDEMVPAAGDPLTLNGDDITLTVNFTENRIDGCKQVSVIVISASNKSKSLVNSFKFDASVRKPCKVRTLKPTATMMPPCKPFRPPTPINLIMLLLNPTGKPTDVTCIIEYQLDDDPDPIKESIIAKSIPYVE